MNVEMEVFSAVVGLLVGRHTEVEVFSAVVGLLVGIHWRWKCSQPWSVC
jgi:hypothetical protein